MVSLIKIGSSQGIIIPVHFIEEACFEGKELVLDVVNGGIFISAKQQPREGWAAAIEDILASSSAEYMGVEWLDSELILEK